MVSAKVDPGCLSAPDADAGTVATDLAAQLGLPTEDVSVSEGEHWRGGYRVDLHAHSPAAAAELRVTVAALLAGCGASVCLAPERHVRTVQLTAEGQDPCVLDTDSDCHAQMMQMFAKEMLPYGPGPPGAVKCPFRSKSVSYGVFA